MPSLRNGLGLPHTGYVTGNQIMFFNALEKSCKKNKRNVQNKVIEVKELTGGFAFIQL